MGVPSSMVFSSSPFSLAISLATSPLVSTHSFTVSGLLHDYWWDVSDDDAAFLMIMSLNKTS
jgi:hypothetical protein